MVGGGWVGESIWGIRDVGYGIGVVCGREDGEGGEGGGGG